jgi:hypothetical protein
MDDYYHLGSVWVFNGATPGFAGGVFRDKDTALEWIAKYQLTGVLTRYPIDVGVYDWAVENGFFTPKKEKHRSPQFIGSFTTAGQEHYHFENGIDLHLEGVEENGTEEE